MSVDLLDNLRTIGIGIMVQLAIITYVMSLIARRLK